MRDGLLGTLDNGGDLLSNRPCGFSSFSLKTLCLLLGNLHALLDVGDSVFDILPRIFDVSTYYAIYSVQFPIC